MSTTPSYNIKAQWSSSLFFTSLLSKDNSHESVPSSAKRPPKILAFIAPLDALHNHNYKGQVIYETPLQNFEATRIIHRWRICWLSPHGHSALHCVLSFVFCFSVRIRASHPSSLYIDYQSLKIITSSTLFPFVQLQSKSPQRTSHS